MTYEVIEGVLIPFVGTSLGAACVLVMRSSLSGMVRRALNGFAAGVMVAASIWSLLIPAMDGAEAMGRWAFVPAVVGFWVGVLFLLILDKVIPHLHFAGHEAEGPKTNLQKTTMLVLAVVLHNLPEGMAVGVIYAARLSGGDVTAAAALALSLGIAIQNFPEGAIISMPLHAAGVSKGRSFLYITLPLIRPMVATAMSLNAIGSLKFFDLIYNMTEGGPNHRTEVLATHLYEQGFKYFKYGYASAIGVVLLLLCLIMTFLINRFVKMDNYEM